MRRIVVALFPALRISSGSEKPLMPTPIDLRHERVDLQSIPGEKLPILDLPVARLLRIAAR